MHYLKRISATLLALLMLSSNTVQALATENFTINENENTTSSSTSSDEPIYNADNVNILENDDAASPSNEAGAIFAVEEHTDAQLSEENVDITENILPSFSDLSEQTLSQTAAGYVVTATGLMPENATLDVQYIPTEEIDLNTLNSTIDTIYAAFDIKILIDGQVYQPQEYGTTLQISVDNLVIPDDSMPVVLRLDDMPDTSCNEATIKEELVDDDAITELLILGTDPDSLTCETDHFTTYIFGGKTYVTPNDSTAAYFLPGREFNAALKSLVSNDSDIAYETEDATVYDIIKVNDPFGIADGGVLVTTNEADSLPAYARKAFDGNGHVIIEIYSAADVWYMNQDASEMFANFNAATQFSILPQFKTFYVNNVSYMFENCTALTYVDLHGWYLSSLSNASGMFYECNALASISSPLLWKLGADQIVGVADYMFYNCYMLQTIPQMTEFVDLASSVSHMFDGCRSLRSLSLEGWADAAFYLQNVSYLCYGCSSLTSIACSSWDTTNSTFTCVHAFEGCSSLQELSLAEWTLSNSSSCSNLLTGCASLTQFTAPANLHAQITLPSDGNVTWTCQHNGATVTDCIMTDNESYIYQSNGSSAFIPGREFNLILRQFNDPEAVMLSQGASHAPTDDVNGLHVLDTYITDIQWKPLADKPADAVLVSVENAINPIYAAYVASTDSNGIVYLYTDAQTVYFNANSSCMLKNLGAATTFSFLSEKINTSRVTSFSDMFAMYWKYYTYKNGNTFINSFHTTELIALDLSRFNTDKAWYCDSMFCGLTKIPAIDISTFSLAQCRWVDSMFYDCKLITTIDTTPFRDNKITDFSYLFSGCRALVSADISNIPTNSATNMAAMFRECCVLEVLDVSHFNTSRVYSMASMFYNCKSATILDVSGFDTSQVQDMSAMFGLCQNLQAIDLTSFDTSNVIDMSEMFSSCKALTAIDTSQLETSNVTDMHAMFSNCVGLSSIDIACMDTSKVTSMSSLVAGCSNLQYIELQNLDTSNVVYFTDMFASCKLLPSIDISSFNTEQATSMFGMFRSCKALTSLDLSNFNTSKVTTMREMFASCENLQELNIASFDTSSCTTFNNMFHNCKNLPVLDVSHMDTSHCTDFGYMFSGCTSLSTIDVAGWDVGSGEKFDDMFSHCTVTTLDLTNWHPTNASNMNWMFWQCTALEHIIFNNFSSLADQVSLDNMFDGCKSLREFDASNFYIANAVSLEDMFRNCESLTTLDLTCIDMGTKTYRDNVAASVYANDVSRIFNACTSLQSVDIHTWDLSSWKPEMVEALLSTCSSAKNLTTIYAPAVSSTDQAGLPTFAFWYIDDNNDDLADTNTKYTTLKNDGLAHVYKTPSILAEVPAAVAATLISGPELNVALKTLVDEQAHTINDINNTITEITIAPGGTSRDDVAMKSGTTRYVLISTPDSEMPAYAGIYTDTNMLIIFSSADYIYFNPQSNSTFQGFAALSDLGIARYNNTPFKLAENLDCFLKDCSSLTNIKWSQLDANNASTNNMLSGCSQLSLFEAPVNLSQTDLPNISSTHWYVDDYSVFYMPDSNEPITTTLENGTVTHKYIRDDDPSFIPFEDLAYFLTGQTFAKTLKTLTNPSVSSYSTADTTITNIKWSSTPFNTTTDASAVEVSSSSSPQKIFARLVNTEIELYTSANTAVAPATASYMFYNFKALTSCDCLDAHFRVSDKTTTVRSMFSGDAALTSVNLAYFDTTEVTNMGYIFNGCSSLQSIDITPFNTTKVTDMSHMFAGCSSLAALDLATIDTSSVTTMAYMFDECASLQTLDLSNFNTPALTTISYMFDECSTLQEITFGSSFNTAQVTDMSFVFNKCFALTSVDVSSFDTANVTTMRAMFQQCKALPSLDVTNFNVEKLENARFVFYNCQSLQTLDLHTWHMDAVTDNTSFITASGLTEFISPASMAIGITLPGPNNTYTWIQDDDYDNFTDNTSPYGGYTVGSSLKASYWSPYTSHRFILPDFAILLGTPKAMNQTFKTLSGSYDSTLTYPYQGEDHVITKIIWNFTNDIDYTATKLCSCGGVPVFATYEDGVITLSTNATKIYMKNAPAALFYNMYALEETDFFEHIDASHMKAGDANHICYNCRALKTIDFGDYTAEHSTSTKSMFCYCENLTSIDLKHINTSEVTDMSYMFKDCKALTSVNLGDNFDTSKTELMSYMFHNCSVLTNIDLGTKFNTQNVQKMDYMFANCSSLTSLNLGYQFITTNVQTMSSMFEKCTKITSLHLGPYFDTSNVTDMAGMFNQCNALTSLNLGNKFDTHNVTTMELMFQACSVLTSLDLGQKFDTSNVTNMRAMFNANPKLQTLNLGPHFNTQQVTTMWSMFTNCQALRSLDLGDQFDTSQVTTMENMFAVCYELQHINFGDKFYTDNVTNTRYMFDNCLKLDSINTSHFNTSKVTDMYRMFNRCKALTELDVSMFDTSHVTTMRAMFSECINLTELDISNFVFTDTTNVEIFLDMSSTSNPSQTYKLTKVVAPANIPSALAISLPAVTDEYIWCVDGDRHDIATDLRTAEATTHIYEKRLLNSYIISVPAIIALDQQTFTDDHGITYVYPSSTNSSHLGYGELQVYGETVVPLNFNMTASAMESGTDTYQAYVYGKNTFANAQASAVNNQYSLSSAQTSISDTLPILDCAAADAIEYPFLIQAEMPHVGTYTGNLQLTFSLN